MKTEDSLLIQEIIKGNEQAFKQIFMRYKDQVYTYSLSILKNEANAQNIVQEVFLKVWLNRNKLDADLSFKSYLFTIAKNQCFNSFKRLANEREFKEYLQSNISHTNSDNPENRLDEFYYRKIKYEAINSLPPKRKMIFQKSRIEGLSYEEISDELGISLSTVKNQMSKALENIRTYLQKHTDITTGLFLLFIFSILTSLVS